MKAGQTWRVSLTVPMALAEAFAEAIAEQADSVATYEVCEGAPGVDGPETGALWGVEATGRSEPERARLVARVAVLAEALGIAEPELAIELVPQLDWVSRTYQGFPPIHAGRFFIHGSHIQEPPPPGAVALTIDAATAFGTGEHASTWGCLMALDSLGRRLRLGSGRQRAHGLALDMGCGSGILALAIARRWHRPVDAVDIDAESVRVARFNARLNQLGGLVHSAGGDGYATALVRRHRPYRLIVANILARPLARMALPLRRKLARGGWAVLSGLLVRQEPLVRSAHRRQGLKLVGRVRRDGWSTLIMRRPGRGA